MPDNKNTDADANPDDRQARKAQEPNDSPEQSMEAGEPGLQGRSRGRIIDTEGDARGGRATPAPEPGPDEHFESGRQKATE